MPEVMKMRKKSAEAKVWAFCIEFQCEVKSVDICAKMDTWLAQERGEASDGSVRVSLSDLTRVVVCKYRPWRGTIGGSKVQGDVLVKKM